MDLDDPEKDLQKQRPVETYEHWRQRKSRVGKNYPLERAEADRKLMNGVSELIKGTHELLYRSQHLEEDPELIAELQSTVKEILKETIAQTKQRIMWVLLQNQVKNQSLNPELKKRVEELTKSNQEISHKIELLLSFYTPALREKTMSELDLKAETFVQKMLANRSRKPK